VPGGPESDAGHLFKPGNPEHPWFTAAVSPSEARESVYRWDSSRPKRGLFLVELITSAQTIFALWRGGHIQLRENQEIRFLQHLPRCVKDQAGQPLLLAQPQPASSFSGSLTINTGIFELPVYFGLSSREVQLGCVYLLWLHRLASQRRLIVFSLSQFTDFQATQFSDACTNGQDSWVVYRRNANFIGRLGVLELAQRLAAWLPGQQYLLMKVEFTSLGVVRLWMEGSLSLPVELDAQKFRLVAPLHKTHAVDGCRLYVATIHPDAVEEDFTMVLEPACGR
jgi:hypothetical protein